jgi:glycerol-3-phosphate acyltransferase PlsX
MEMRIIVDAMGGDNAPLEIVKGAIDAGREFGVDITLVGREDDILDCFKAEGINMLPESIKIVNASEVITMEDDPSTATRRKKDSSMAVGLTLLRDGKGDAFISAGSTGALLTGSTLTVKRIRGIRRAAMAPVLPNGGAGVLLVDCGANLECTPEYLLQFAFMGSFYAQTMMGRNCPKVGLLNIGAEETKGTELQKQAFELLREAGKEGRINFVGNVESRDVLFGTADVVVADGFTGNIFLKAIEGTAIFLMKQIKGTFLKNKKNKIAALMVRNDIGELRSLLDASEVGGTAMLGIDKPVFKAHGSSDARAIRSTIKQAVSFVDSGIIGKIKDNIEFMTLNGD